MLFYDHEILFKYFRKTKTGANIDESFIEKLNEIDLCKLWKFSSRKVKQIKVNCEAMKWKKEFKSNLSTVIEWLSAQKLSRKSRKLQLEQVQSLTKVSRSINLRIFFLENSFLLRGESRWSPNILVRAWTETKSPSRNIQSVNCPQIMNFTFGKKS